MDKSDYAESIRDADDAEKARQNNGESQFLLMEDVYSGNMVS